MVLQCSVWNEIWAVIKKTRHVDRSFEKWAKTPTWECKPRREARVACWVNIGNSCYLAFGSSTKRSWSCERKSCKLHIKFQLKTFAKCISAKVSARSLIFLLFTCRSSFSFLHVCERKFLFLTLFGLKLIETKLVVALMSNVPVNFRS